MAEEAMMLGEVIARLEREQDRERVVENGWTGAASWSHYDSWLAFKPGAATVAHMLGVAYGSLGRAFGETTRVAIEMGMVGGSGAHLTPSRLEAILAPTAKRELLGSASTPDVTASTQPMVIVESPYAGAVAANLAYAARCLRDSLDRGEAPFASHVLYTLDGVLDDNDPAQRKAGMEAGFTVGARADYVAVYIDRGVSPGMVEGIMRAQDRGQRVEFRAIGGGDEAD